MIQPLVYDARRDELQLQVSRAGERRTDDRSELLELLGV